MIQYFLDLENQVKFINDQRLSYGQIQKIYSTSFFISFSIRSPGKTWHLYLGRGSGHEGVWLHESPPKSELRRKDTFLEYLRRHITSCSLVDIELDKYDRVLRLNYQKFGQLQSFFFFWKARKLFFIHLYQEQLEGPFKILLSWQGKAINYSPSSMSLYDLFNEVGRRTDMKHDLNSSKNLSIIQLLEEELKSAQLLGMHSSPTFLQRKIGKIEEDLRKTKQWILLQNFLENEEDLSLYEIKIGDHQFKFDAALNLFERRNLVFQKIKKLKKGESILSGRLLEAKELLETKKNPLKKNSLMPIIRPVWGKEEKRVQLKPQEAQTRNDFKIFKFSGFDIGVGLNTSGNDQLRNMWGNKDDIWVHLDGVKSAHAVIKCHQKASLTPEMLNLGASIVAHFSQETTQWIAIIYTAVKNLRGVTGSPGMVTYKKEKHLRCAFINSSEWQRDE